MSDCAAIAWKGPPIMLTGVYQATRKDNTIYYRSGIQFRGKHISLGSFDSEQKANSAYLEASRLLDDRTVTIHNVLSYISVLPHEKAVVLVNFRDNGIYIKNPIFLCKGYFIYFLSPAEELKFDRDDLFYYSSHKILRRQGHLYVNDYGMQCSLLSRYGIKPYAVAGRDYFFANGDNTDYRYSNLIIKNHYHGVLAFTKNGMPRYKTQIHINGNYIIGAYRSEEKAAIAYNKAADLAKAAGLRKNFPENYVEIPPKEYAELYSTLKISEKYLRYLKMLSSTPAISD